MTDVLRAKIDYALEAGITSFGHDGEVYSDLRSYTTSSGVKGHLFDHGEKKDPYLKVYFISEDGSYLSVWERGYGTEHLRFNTTVNDDPEQTLNDRFTSLNDQLDEAVFHARLQTAVDAYEETGVPQEFEWRGNNYTNLHDLDKSHVDYRFDYGQGDQLKVFVFAEDGSYVTGWSRAGQKTFVHPDRTETDNLYQRLQEVDELLPSSYAAPLTLEDHLDIIQEKESASYETLIHGFQIAGRDMLVIWRPSYDIYNIYPDYDFVNSDYLNWIELTGDRKSFFIENASGDIAISYQWDWSSTGDAEVGSILYGNGLKDTLYSRMQLIEYELNVDSKLYYDLWLTANFVQAADGDTIKVVTAGIGTDVFGNLETTDFDAIMNIDRDGVELQSFNFTSQAYNLLDYGEFSDVEGSFDQGSYNFYLEAYDVLGYSETFIFDIEITERQNGGYTFNLDTSITNSIVSVECSANAVMNEDLRVVSRNVDCSDNDVESDIEDVLDETLVGSLEYLQDENLVEAVSIGNSVGFVDETALVYVGAFAPIDNDDWFL